MCVKTICVVLRVWSCFPVMEGLSEMRPVMLGLFEASYAKIRYEDKISQPCRNFTPSRKYHCLLALTCNDIFVEWNGTRF